LYDLKPTTGKCHSAAPEIVRPPSFSLLVPPLAVAQRCVNSGMSEVDGKCRILTKYRIETLKSILLLDLVKSTGQPHMPNLVTIHSRVPSNLLVAERNHQEVFFLAAILETIFDLPACC